MKETFSRDDSVACVSFIFIGLFSRTNLKSAIHLLFYLSHLIKAHPPNSPFLGLLNLSLPEYLKVRRESNILGCALDSSFKQ